MKIEVDAQTLLSVSVNPVDVLEELKQNFGFKDYRNSWIIEKDNKLYRQEDTSYHGSPAYEYKLISDNIKDVEVFKALNIILEYLKNK